MFEKNLILVIVVYANVNITRRKNMNEQTENYAKIMADYIVNDEEKKEAFMKVCNTIYDVGYRSGIRDERITSDENKEFPQ